MMYIVSPYFSRRLELSQHSLAISFFVLLSLLGSIELRADPQSQSYSSWQTVGDQLQVRYTIAEREVSRLLRNDGERVLAEVLRAHLDDSVSVSVGENLCKPAQPSRSRAARSGYLVTELRFDCSSLIPDSSLTITLNALFDHAPSHIHFAKFNLAGSARFEKLFSGRNRTHTASTAITGLADQVSGKDFIASATGGWADVLPAYITLGFQHILEGLDHIAFLLALIIISTRMRDILLIVTGFTIGHSITLSLAVLNIVKPNIAVVESIIGLSIALVAVENIAVRSPHQRLLKYLFAGSLLLLALYAWQDNQLTGPSSVALFGLALFCFCYLGLSNDASSARFYRPMITLLFGLVHGFGFANVLNEVGIPEGNVLPALLGFNVGVELGQVVIVLVISLFTFFLYKTLAAQRRQQSGDLLSAALCCLGVYWFVQRAYFQPF